MNPDFKIKINQFMFEYKIKIDARIYKLYVNAEKQAVNTIMQSLKDAGIADIKQVCKVFEAYGYMVTFDNFSIAVDYEL